MATITQALLTGEPITAAVRRSGAQEDYGAPWGARTSPLFLNAYADRVGVGEVGGQDDELIQAVGS